MAHQRLDAHSGRPARAQPLHLHPPRPGGSHARHPLKPLHRGCAAASPALTQPERFTAPSPRQHPHIMIDHRQRCLSSARSIRSPRRRAAAAARPAARSASGTRVIPVPLPCPERPLAGLDRHAERRDDRERVADAMHARDPSGGDLPSSARQVVADRTVAAGRMTAAGVGKRRRLPGAAGSGRRELREHRDDAGVADCLMSPDRASGPAPEPAAQSRPAPAATAEYQVTVPHGSPP